MTTTAPSRASRPLVVGAGIVAVAFAAPAAYVVADNLGPDSALTEVIREGDLWGPLVRTLLLAGSVSVASAAVGTALAWLTARSDIPGRRLWRTLAPVPLVVPSFLAAATFVSSFGRQGLLTRVLGPVGVESLPRPEGFLGAWFVLVLFTYPYVYLPVSSRLLTLPPSLEESARLLGRRPLAVFRTIVWPQARPAVRAGGLLVFLYTVSEFGAVVVMRYDTLTRSIYANRVSDRPRSMALALVLASVALIVVVAERRLARRAAVIEAAGARRPLQVPLGRARWPVAGLTALFFAAALLAPAATLVRWVLRAGVSDGSSGLGLDWADIGGLVVSTAWVSAAAAVVAVVAVLPAAYLTARRRSLAAGPVNALIVTGFALPGIVIALALISWTLSSDLLGIWYQTYALLVAAYVVHFGAQALRSAQVAVGAVPQRLVDAARVLGARRGRVLRTIELPVMLPGLAAGAGLVLLSTMKELPVTLLLSPLGFESLATRIWSTYNEGLLGDAGVASLILLGTSAVLTWLLVVRRTGVLAQ